jgi:hypothetical protein
MTELAFPEIDAPRADVATIPAATLKDTALASFVPIEAHMRTLAARFKDVAYDVATPKGMKDAKAARLVLRDEGRYAVQRLQKRLKDEANDLKRTLDAKAEELIAITLPVESAIDGQITAHETKLAAEKAERERIERERVAALEQRLAGLSVWIDRCKAPGMTAERIAAGIKMLQNAPLGDDWAEFKSRAEARKAEVLDVMCDMRLAAEAREAEAARLEAQRLENERIAAEQKAEAERLAEQQRLLAEQAAELQRKADAIAAQERAAAQALADKEAADVAAAQQAEAKRIHVENDRAAAERTSLVGWVPQAAEPGDYIPPASMADEQQPQTEAEIEAANGPEVDLPPAKHVITIELEEAAPLELPPTDEPATLKLGAISARLGFTVTAAFMAFLCLEPAGRDKSAVLYRESQWPGIKAALVKHIEGLQ